MSAPLRIFLTFAALAAGVIASASAFLFWTPPGRASLRELAATIIGDAFSGDASVAALKGKLPGEIILENVKITDAGEEWLTVQRAELRWRPFSLIGRKVDIDLFRIDGARLLDAPPDRQDDHEKPRGLELPDRLPNIRVKALILSDFRVADAIAGSEVRVDGGGSIEMGGPTLKVSLKAASNDERDYLSAQIERAGDALATNVTVRSQSDGALAAIAKLGGPIQIEAKGDGPLAAYRLDFRSMLGGYGALGGAVFADIKRMETISFKAEAELGERLKNTARIIGPEASIEGEWAPHDGGGALTISSFKSNLGQAKGKARWQNRNKALESVKINASAELDSEWRPDIRPYIGDNISVDGEIRPKSGRYSAAGKVSATHFDGVLKSIETDLRTFARGPADIHLKSNEAMPPAFDLGADATGEFNLLFGDSIEAAPIEVKTNEGGSFGGDAYYNFDTRAFSVKGDVSVSPKMIFALNRKLAARRNAGGVINIKGTLDKFSGTIAATTPPLLYDKKPFPAARVTLAFADAPATPSGQVAVRAVGDARRFDANFAKNPSGAWRAAGIDYVGADFALKGSATLDPAGGEIALDLAYRGVGAAEPWPGFPLAGDIAAKGAVARGASSNQLAVYAGALASRNWSLSGLSTTVEGPSNRLAVKASADFLTVKGAAPISKLTAEMTAALENALRVTVSKLSADIAGAPLKLSQPSQVTFGDGVTIENFRAAIGRNGSLALDGAIDRTRWRGKLAARRAPIVSAASVVDLDLDFDTNRQTPATGSFKLSSLLTKTENATLSGKLVWNGRTLDIADDGAAEALDLSLSLPARLTRSPQISISTDGPLNGRASYSGRIETIAGFLPAVLQSIEGGIAFTGSASGTLAEPKLAGTVGIANGAFTELATGLSIVNIDASARAEGALTGSQIVFNASGSGHNQKEKTIFANGSISIGREPRLSSKTTFNGAKLSAGPVSEVEASGEVDLSGPFRSLLATGELTISSLDARVFTPESTGLVDVNVVAVEGNGGPAPGAIGAAAPTTVNYAVRINGDDRIFVRGRGLTSEWRANVEIAGRADQPVILGAMTMKNGEITFAGRRFEMTKGEIAFDRLSVNNPSLDLRAERKTRSGTQAAIVIGGRARAPKVTLTSTPTLPPEDIMALILFDKPASELSAIESLQVAEGLAELGGIGPFGGAGITGSARQALGLDLLNVDIDGADSAASSLTVGKYVADGLFVSATQDARGENGSVRVEYEIDQSFTVETELRQDGEQTVSANWKHDF